MYSLDSDEAPEPLTSSGTENPPFTPMPTGPWASKGRHRAVKKTRNRNMQTSQRQARRGNFNLAFQDSKMKLGQFVFRLTICKPTLPLPRWSQAIQFRKPIHNDLDF